MKISELKLWIMGRFTIIILIFLFISFSSNSQVYQLPNGGFEMWDGDGENDEPTYWNGFTSAKCDIAIGCGIATKTRHARSTDIRGGAEGNYSCKIFATRIDLFNVIANGNITTGQIRVGTSNTSSLENYNVTRTANPNHRQFLHAKPDSIRFWAKFECPSSTQEARMSATIHDDYDFRDPSGTDPNAPSHIVGKAILNFNRGDQSWKQYSVKFNYDDYPSNTPVYILLTFTTNKEAGEGSASDYLFIDDIEMVYNVDLRDIKLNGQILAGFDPDITEYETDVECNSTNNLITATSMSPNATIDISQGSKSNPVTIITVTSGDQTKEYRITLRYRAYEYIEDIICQGDEYYRNGFELPVHINPGTYTYTRPLSSSGECDSVMSLKLKVNPVYLAATPTDIMICENSSYDFFGRPLTEEGRYDTLVHSLAGCDSLVILNLRTGDHYEYTINETICEGEVYRKHGFNVSRTGFYTKRYPSAECDTVLNLNLTVNESYDYEIFDTIYSGAYYNRYGFVIRDTDTIGTIDSTLFLETINGCDSIVTLNLNIRKYEVEAPPTSPNFNFEVFPVPANDMFKIYIDDYQADDLFYQLYNSYGTLISGKRIVGNYHEVNVSGLRAGMYLIKVYLNEEYYKTKKIMIY